MVDDGFSIIGMFNDKIISGDELLSVDFQRSPSDINVKINQFNLSTGNQKSTNYNISDYIFKMNNNFIEEKYFIRVTNHYLSGEKLFFVILFTLDTGYSEKRVNWITSVDILS